MYGPLGMRKKRKIAPIRNMKLYRKIATLRGKLPVWSIAIIGMTMNKATAAEIARADDTTIGIGLMKSPIIPVAKRSGRKAQTVVIVVTKITERKFRYICVGYR